MKHLQFGAHLDAKACVEIGQRFIQKKHFWVPNQGSPHRNSLTLTTGQGLGKSIQQGFNAEAGRSPLHHL